jgi:hypothetical protein
MSDLEHSIFLNLSKQECKEQDRTLIKLICHINMSKNKTPIISAVQLINAFVQEVYLFLSIPEHHSTGYPKILQ